MEQLNTVIAGDYLGGYVVLSIHTQKLYIAPNIKADFIEINKDTVASYNVMDEEQRKSATSAVSRAAIGGFFLGTAGLFAGISAKNKRNFIVELCFTDGKKSLLFIDEKNYMALMKILF